jgi:4-hydroxy-tetrahydrodipicolinate synthase
MIRLQGSITAIITPFRDGEIDWKAFDDFIEWQIACGSHGLVACGTTGESPTLSHDEHMRILERAVDVVKGRIPLIAGSGSNSTREAVNLTKHAEQVGADAALVVTPYYNKPTQEGLYQHYKAIAQSTALPILIYNIPGRCVIDMKPETMARVAADCKNIIGVKDATADLARVQQTFDACGPDFIQLSGEDATVGAFLEQGGHGCISVTSNVAPVECAGLHNAWRLADLSTFRSLEARLAPLNQALFIETSPAPVKYACSRLGFGTDEVRLPLVKASEAARHVVDEAMDAAGVLPVMDEDLRLHAAE